MMRERPGGEAPAEKKLARIEEELHWLRAHPSEEKDVSEEQFTEVQQNGRTSFAAFLTREVAQLPTAIAANRPCESGNLHQEIS
jgi:hypothetical protein